MLFYYVFVINSHMGEWDMILYKLIPKKSVSWQSTHINAFQGSLKTNKLQKMKRRSGKSTDINKKNSWQNNFR